MLEREGHAVPAALAYGAALANAPPDESVDAATLQAIRRGREVHGAYTKQLGEHIHGTIAAAESDCTVAERRRIDSFIKMTLRVQPRYQQSPSEYYYPGLPPIEFFDRSEFPWMEEFEAQTDAIRAELMNALREQRGGLHALHPLRRAHAAGPVARTQQLTALDVVRVLPTGPADRRPLRTRARDDACRAVTAASRCAVALARCDVLRTCSREPAYPRTPAWPISGWWSTCRWSSRRAAAFAWAARHASGGSAKSWVFDDTIEHEAWNDSDVPRYILICDIWNPRLSPQERAAIAGVIAATDAFNGTVPSAQV